jgi:hypothetical protein
VFILSAPPALSKRRGKLILAFGAFPGDNCRASKVLAQQLALF